MNLIHLKFSSFGGIISEHLWLGHSFLKLMLFRIYISGVYFDKCECDLMICHHRSIEWLFGWRWGLALILFTKAPGGWGSLQGCNLVSEEAQPGATGRSLRPSADSIHTVLVLSAQSSERHFSGLHVCKLCWFTFSDIERESTALRNGTIAFDGWDRLSIGLRLNTEAREGGLPRTALDAGPCRWRCSGLVKFTARCHVNSLQ